MAYDMVRQVTVLFGGYDYDGSFVNGETWEWNGASWTQLYPNPAPSPRFGHRMAYDVFRGVVVLFGGVATNSNSGVLNGETWEWNGTAWTRRTVSGSSPRDYHAMAYDTVRQKTVLFGGSTGGGSVGGFPNGETWELGVSCYANCDGSTVAPVLTANDFQCFLNAFASGTAYANCDGSTLPPVLTANDFQCFLNAFAAGCP